jgi:hypothetical protein
MTKAEKMEKLNDRIEKEAVRMYIFSDECPSCNNPYKEKAITYAKVVKITNVDINVKWNNIAKDIAESILLNGFGSNKQLSVLRNFIERNYDAEQIEKIDSHIEEKKNEILLQVRENRSLWEKYLAVAERHIKIQNEQYAASFHRRSNWVGHYGW